MIQPVSVSQILRASPVVMEALTAARDVAPPDWLLGAGAIRDAVWDALHDRPAAMPRDLDLSFFDPADLSPERDEAVVAALRARAPGLPWEAKNQAAVHVWYARRFGFKVRPFGSSAEAVATFPETASCVGVRLLDDGELLVVAPYGLDDLLGGVCRHNPTRVSARFYARRVREKGWRERWPRVRFLPPVILVEREPTPVMFLETADDPASIGEGWRRLEDVVALRGRRFLGAVDDRSYRACVVRRDGDDPLALGLEGGLVPGGRYLRSRLCEEPPALYEQIPAAVALLEGAAEPDRRRPVLELYRRRDVVDVLLPV
jgi:uncharacterized protein